MIKKLSIGIVVIGLIAAIAIYFAGSKALSSGVKVGIETLGPKITQTPVTIDAVKLSPISGGGTLEGLKVGNPEGFKQGDIFSLGKIHLQVDTASVVSDTIVIKKIHIFEPAISYEKKLTTSNVKQLLKNIEQFTGPAEETTTEEPKTESASKKLVIEELIIDGGKVYVGLLGVGQTLPLPRIEMRDIGKSDDDASIADVLDEIIKKVLGSVGTAVSGAADLGKDAANAGIDKVGEAGKAATEGIKKLFGN